jgi:hypothetical protein
VLNDKGEETGKKFPAIPAEIVDMIKKHMTDDFLSDKDKQSVIDFANSGEN